MNLPTSRRRCVLAFVTSVLAAGAVVSAPADRKRLADGSQVFVRRVELRWMGRGRDPEMFFHTQRDFHEMARRIGLVAYTRVTVSDDRGRRYRVERSPKDDNPRSWSGPWPGRFVRERWHVVDAPPAGTPMLVTVIPDPEVEGVGKFRPKKDMTATFRLSNTPEQREQWARHGKNPQ